MAEIKQKHFHRIDGPAVDAFYEHSSGGYHVIFYYINGTRFYSKEEWFEALTPEEKQNYIWNMNEDN